MNKKLFNSVLVFMLYIVRPLFGPAQCYFALSCTKYAQQQLETNSFFRALVAIVKRLLLCNPLYPLLLKRGLVNV